MKRHFGFVMFALLLGACGDEWIGGDDPATVADETSPTGPGESPPVAAPSLPDEPSPTAPEASKAVRFIAVGDTGTGENPQFKVANAISAVCKARGCDFVQLLGDNIYESGASSPDDPIFQSHFEIPYAAIDLDFWVVLGNHDYGHNGLGTDFGRGQHEIDYTSRSKKWKLPSAYWNYAPPTGKGAVEFFGLDTTMAMFGRDAEQRTDMAARIAASTAEWKIALGHHPYKSNGSHGNAGEYDAILGIPIPLVDGKNVKSFLEETICGKVDLYLAGHDHSRQWLNESCMGTELAVSGAGAKSTTLGGKNASLFESLELGFLYIVIDDKTLTAEFVDDSGNTEFTHTIVKP